MKQIKVLVPYSSGSYRSVILNHMNKEQFEVLVPILRVVIDHMNFMTISNRFTGSRPLFFVVIDQIL